MIGYLAANNNIRSIMLVIITAKSCWDCIAHKLQYEARA